MISLLAVSCLIAVVIEHTFNIVTEYGIVFLHDPCLQLLVQLCSCGMPGVRVSDTGAFIGTSGLIICHSSRVWKVLVMHVPKLLLDWAAKVSTIIGTLR